MVLELIRKRCQGGRFVITSRPSPAGAADPSRVRPLRSPRLRREPSASGSSLHRASEELSVVLGERNWRGRPEERRQVEKQNARLAKAVRTATLRPTETFRIQLEEGEGESPFWVISSP